MKLRTYILTAILSSFIIVVLTAAILFIIIQPISVADENYELEEARLNKEDPNYEGNVERLKDSIEQAELFMNWSYKDLYGLQAKLGLAEKEVYKGEFEFKGEFARFFEDYLRLSRFADTVRQSLYIAESQAIKMQTPFFEQWQSILKEKNIAGLQKAFGTEDAAFAGKDDKEVLQILEGFLKKGEEETIDLIHSKLEKFDPIKVDITTQISPITKIKITGDQDLKSLESTLVIYPKVEFVEMLGAIKMIGSNKVGPLVILNDELKDTTPTSVDLPGPLFEKMSVLIDGSTTESDPFRAMVELKDTAVLMNLLTTPLAKELLGKETQFVWEDEIQIGETGAKLLTLFALNRKRESIQIRSTDVKHASPVSGAHGFQVGIEFNQKAALKWKRMTEENINRCIAILVNDKVLSWPRVNEAIGNGMTSISGNFTAVEAANIAYSITSSERKLIPLKLISAEYEKEPITQKRSWWSIIYILLITTLIGTLAILVISYIISKVREGYQ